ncbi:helix-turn-helix protein [Nonomuraea fuscirosea]|uniref:Helix-turn-helix protein n=1 Tax=Nonomuraea fuscirosea TaxID=1291556 RepID=A0A2T0MXY0_9ACTN|nr:winged helix-turn-helix domain-containing protein [Nonomuraea fuscirosea]PRX64104.1 helix-turn-helix protein [Nonomuraea fuscirosea]
MRLLFALAPPWGYSADFLTPPGAPGDFDAAVERVLATPPRLLRADIEQLPGRPTPDLTDLRSGRPLALRRLGTALTSYHRRTVGPYWSSVDAAVRAEQARLAREFLRGGAEAVLTALRPYAIWQPPVLSLPLHPADRDVNLDGCGLILVPSFYCWRAPTTLKDHNGPQVLVYPIGHDPGWLAHDPAGPSRSLARLLGATRASVLTAVADASATTTDIARRIHISPASASEHARTLQDAGLLIACRQGNRVYHVLTELGARLVRGSATERAN